MTYQKNSGILSVSEFTQTLKTTLELQFRFVHIQGEISNLRIPYSGHIYFTLKDQTAQLRAVMFKGQTKYLTKPLEDGQSVICHGRLSVYEPRGEYQIIIDTIDFSGAGNLQLEFEKLKASLAQRGFFDNAIKKALPPFPEKIVLITSPTGAAVFDFLKIAEKRGYWGNIMVFPVSVQGKRASSEIAQAITAICSSGNADILVLLRGGGSLEDLWAFNEEQTAQAIHDATIPVATGIGHETDYTIADMCGDLHAHTPTAVAEAIIPDATLLRKNIIRFREVMASTLEKKINNNEEKVQSLRRLVGDLDLYLANHSLQLDYVSSAFINAGNKLIERTSAKLENVVGRLIHRSPGNVIEIQKLKVAQLEKQLKKTAISTLQLKETKLSRQAALLDSVSPLSVLARGYSIVSTIEKPAQKKKIVSATHQVTVGDMVDITLHQGGLECEVIKKKGDQ